MYLFVLVLFISPRLHQAQRTLLLEEFYNGIKNNTFDSIIDVRTQNEWDSGHIPNATHIENLQMMDLPPLPSILDGNCNSRATTVVVYCRSGSRARSAIWKLKDAGFKGTLLNGLGVSQWEGGGYDLVMTKSQNPLCSVGNNINDLTSAEVEEETIEEGMDIMSLANSPIIAPTESPTLDPTESPTIISIESPSSIPTGLESTTEPTSEPTALFIDHLVDAPTLAIYYGHPDRSPSPTLVLTEESDDQEDEPCAWFPFVNLC